MIGGYVGGEESFTSDFDRCGLRDVTVCPQLLALLEKLKSVVEAPSLRTLKINITCTGLLTKLNLASLAMQFAIFLHFTRFQRLDS